MAFFASPFFASPFFNTGTVVGVPEPVRGFVLAATITGFTLEPATAGFTLEPE